MKSVTRRSLIALPLLAAIPACATSNDDAPAITNGSVDVGGAALPYWDTGGSSTPIILLHAFAGSLESWPGQQRPFARAGFRVIAYSRRGVGASTPSTEAINHAEDLSRFMDGLDIPRAHLVTVAGGATVAADFMISNPSRVSSAVLACSLISFQDPLLLAARQAAAAAFNRPEEPRATPAERELSQVYRESNPEGTRRWIEIQQRAQSAGLARTAQTNEVTLGAIAASGVPLLLIAGEHDHLLTPAVALEVAARLPNSEVRIVRNAGHQAHWEQPEAFNEHVLAFLRRRRAAAR